MAGLLRYSVTKCEVQILKQSLAKFVSTFMCKPRQKWRSTWGQMTKECLSKLNFQINIQAQILINIIDTVLLEHRQEGSVWLLVVLYS